MTYFINKFKIPTLLGLGVILLGLGSGLYLTFRQQIFLSQAAPDVTPQNITYTNTLDDSIVISWQTSSPASSFITFGQNSPSGQTALDDQDSTSPKPHSIHYVTLKNLLPKTSYQFKIVSGRFTSEVFKFDTTPPLNGQTGFTPIIGSVLTDKAPLNDGIAYLSIPGAVTQSALIKPGGNFLIPIAKIAKLDHSDTLPLSEGMTGKITIVSDIGAASLLFELKANSSPLPPLKIGQNVDLTIPEQTPAPNPAVSDANYDLNNDGKINSADYALLSACLGKKPDTAVGGKSCNKADINGDGIIDQKDLDLISQRLKAGTGQ